MNKAIVDLLQDRYELVYVDYRESLEESLDAVQAAVQAQDWQPLDERVDGWFFESEDYGVDYALGELRGEIEERFQVDEERAADFIENHRDELVEIIEDRDDSNPLEDLLHNTPDQPVFYDTGVEVDTNTWEGGEALKINLRRVKKALRIPAHNKTWDKELSLMLLQSSYGGKLVIYWYADLQDLMKIRPYDAKKPANMVEFKNPMIAVVDHVDGSGDHTDLEGWIFSLPLNTENIFIDKTIKYNYTFSVCGMYSSWCDCTKVRFYHKRGKQNAERSSIHDHMEQEAQFNKRFAEGGCTFGDMDTHRHRNVYYLNEYPCGSHCPNCGTFWID